MHKHHMFILALGLIAVTFTGGAAGAPDHTAIHAGTPGTLTITASPFMGKNYFFGDKVTFSGINTASGTTYLFIAGPNLKANGSQIQNNDPRTWPVADGDASTFVSVPVRPGKRWSWTWDTHDYHMDRGKFTIYAVSEPRDLSHLNEAVYCSTDISIERPTISATAKPTEIVRRGTVTISGIARGHPDPGVAIWVIGPVYSNRYVVPVKPDGRYSMKLNVGASLLEQGDYPIKLNVDTSLLDQGDYQILVQHPNVNDKFDITTTSDGSSDVWVQNLEKIDPSHPVRLFKFQGPGKLKGKDAYDALVEGINDPAVDDFFPAADSNPWDPLPGPFHFGKGYRTGYHG